MFADCLVKYIDVLGRKGCCRTALEVCKLVLGICPTQDPKGILLRIDYYALRAKEYDYLKRFICQRKNDKKPKVAELLPNLLMSSAICKRHLVKEESKANERIEKSWIAVCKGIT